MLKFNCVNSKIKKFELHSYFLYAGREEYGKKKYNRLSKKKFLYCKCQEFFHIEDYINKNNPSYYPKKENVLTTNRSIMIRKNNEDGLNKVHNKTHFLEKSCCIGNENFAINFTLFIVILGGFVIY